MFDLLWHSYNYLDPGGEPFLWLGCCHLIFHLKDVKARSRLVVRARCRKILNFQLKWFCSSCSTSANFTKNLTLLHWFCDDIFRCSLHGFSCFCAVTLKICIFEKPNKLYFSASWLMEHTTKDFRLGWAAQTNKDRKDRGAGLQGEEKMIKWRTELKQLCREHLTSVCEC